MHDLNPQQQEVLKCTSGPMLILAGAGSGKTRVITYKFAHLAKSRKVSPDSIFTVTFTNKAALEMKERIQHLLGKDMGHAWIGTLHSQCGKILRKEIRGLGYENDFSIYDEDDRCKLIRHILKEFKIHEALYKGVSSRINFLKASLVGPDDFLSSGDGFGFDEKLARVYVRYQDELKRSNALDFDDLIMLAVKLFRDCPRTLKKYQDAFSYILIDEFQDLNASQYELVRLLSQAHRNINAVGDDDQSIYKFRGANVEHILKFEKDFPGAKVVRLERNYRSTQNILDVSNAVITRNSNRREKKLWTDRGCGEKVHFCWLDSEEEEAKHIAKIIKELYLKGAFSFRDIGVLYRVNLQSRVLEDALRAEDIPYHVVGGIGFYQRKEVKDVIAYVRLVLNHGDNMALRRIINVPQRGIGTATFTKIENEAKKKSLSLFEAMKWCVRNSSVAPSTREKLQGFIKLIEKLSSVQFKSPDEMIRQVAEKSGYLAMLDEERRQNLDELIASAEGRDVREFLDKISLVTNLDDTVKGDHISLLTLHNAKGLEFPVVFAAGLEEGLLPYFKANGHDDEIAEERRLFYVGMTRAKDLLFLSGARKRRLYAKVQDQEPSRFLKDIPRQCCMWIEKIAVQRPVRQFPLRKKAEPKRAVSPFASGCRVKHPVWGIGVIRDCYGDGDDQKVMVNFPNIGIKRLSLKLAGLTKL